jgi:hypothetical protein
VRRVLQGLTHTDLDTLAKNLVDCTPVEKKTRVGDGCSKRRRSRNRNQGASVHVERAIGARFAGLRGKLGLEDTGKERKTVGGGPHWQLLREIWWPDKNYLFRLGPVTRPGRPMPFTVEVLEPGQRTARAAQRLH